MTDTRQVTEASQALKLMMAGNARVTIVSPKTGDRYTYRVRQSKDGQVHFVQLMMGSNNETDFQYIGLIGRDGQPRLTKASHVNADSKCWRAFTFTYAHLRAGSLPVEFWHEGRCCRCGRTLTVPESIESGIGPECSKIMGGS